MISLNSPFTSIVVLSKVLSSLSPSFGLMSADSATAPSLHQFCLRDQLKFCWVAGASGEFWRGHKLWIHSSCSLPPSQTVAGLVGTLMNTGDFKRHSPDAHEPHSGDFTSCDSAESPAAFVPTMSMSLLVDLPAPVTLDMSKASYLQTPNTCCTSDVLISTPRDPQHLHLQRCCPASTQCLLALVSQPGAASFEG